MRLSLLLLSSLAALTLGRRNANCGLSCFRYDKCMGKLDGSHGNRPGQLGDTGIIVLQHCGPLKKEGCVCSSDLETEDQPEATPATPTSRFSKTKTRSFKPRSNSVRSKSSTQATTTTERSSLRALFNRSRVYRSKRLTGANQRY